MKHASKVQLIFPHQLFMDHIAADADRTMILVEDDLFFKQYSFHKQKLILHRASMRHFAEVLKAKKYQVITIETSSCKSMEVLNKQLKDLQTKDVSYYDLVDDWLQRDVDALVKRLDISVERLVSPGFLTSRGQIYDYFDNKSKRMQHFYEWQRKRLDILMDGSKPQGGQWSYDTANRKKLPKNITLPPSYTLFKSEHISQAQSWVKTQFADNPGDADMFNHAVTHEQATQQLNHFIHERLAYFGPYEDAIAENESQLFHSALSSALNCGLLTPQQVIDAVLKHAKHNDIPIESLEGFIRQLIGWREYIRATYVQFGRDMRSTNELNFKKPLNKGWYDAHVGIKPIDTTIKRVLHTAYAHHIERLMILGNSMMLLRIKPDDAYEWFMSMFIDAYDWVMVPNVYAMSQFAAGDMITTKPYISGSNYIIKMSNYKKEDWSVIWDSLYWQFIDDNRIMIENNYRTKMVVSLYDRFSDDKKKHIADTSSDWLK